MVKRSRIPDGNPRRPKENAILVNSLAQSTVARKAGCPVPRIVLAFCIFILASCFSIRVHAMPVLVLTDDFSEARIGGKVEVAYDESDALPFDAVRAEAIAFAPSTKEVPNFGYRAGAEWARLSLDDRRTEKTPLVLDLAYTITDRLEVFVERNGAVTSFVAGDHTDHRAWPIDARLPSFPVGQGSANLWIRLSGGATHQLPLTLRTREIWHEVAGRENIAQAAYYGALGAMLLYNALVWAAVGLRLYGSYVAFLGCYGLFSLSLNGVLFAHVWPSAAYLNDHIVIPAICGIGIFGFYFTLALLDLGRFRSLAKTAERVISGSAMAIGVVSLLLPYASAMPFLLVFIGVWSVTLMVCGVVAAVRGEVLGRLYLVAWSAFIAGVVINAFRVVGYLPTNAVTVNAHQVGSAIEFLLLSFALADRIKRLQAEATSNAELAATSARAAQAAADHALEAEKRLGEERDQFVANTSHELRTPLNGMLGLVEAVRMRDGDSLSEASRRGLAAVTSSGQRLAALVGDLLDFSAAQRGTIVLHRAPTHVGTQAGFVADLLRSTLEGRPVELIVDLPPELPAADVDPHRLQQILFNIVGNAIKFTEKGSIRIGAQAHEGTITVRIRDTGTGISEHAQARIFEAFQQADGGVARRFGGTGLGLAITKQLVEAHGGQVGVSSTPGFGSTFWFTLPASATNIEANVVEAEGPISFTMGAKAQALREQLEAAGAGVGRASRGHMFAGAPPSGRASWPASNESAEKTLTILVADDEAVNRQVLIELLSLGGYNVQTATNGREAVESVRRSKPDVVLLDVMMPELSGYDALSQLRADYDELELPVLLLTARAQAKDLVEGFRRGATDYIVKPFAAAEVLARIQHQARLQFALARARELRHEGEAMRATLGHAEEQLLHSERLATIGAATGGIAHDLCNPLHHMLTAFDQISEHAGTITGGAARGAGEAQSDVLAIADWASVGLTSGRNALAIADTIRAAMRTETGASELVLLDDIVDDALLILGHKLRSFQVERVRAPGAMIETRRTEALQVVMNLVANAADALEEAKTLRMSVGLAAVGDRIELAVEDNGRGVPDALRAKILEPFFTTKPRGKGTGLGLATVATIAGRWGADLAVSRSERLGGAAFRVTMTRARLC